MAATTTEGSQSVPNQILELGTFTIAMTAAKQYNLTAIFRSAVVVGGITARLNFDNLTLEQNLVQYTFSYENTNYETNLMTFPFSVVSSGNYEFSVFLDSQQAAQFLCAPNSGYFSLSVVELT